MNGRRRRRRKRKKNKERRRLRLRVGRGGGGGFDLSVYPSMSCAWVTTSSQVGSPVRVIEVIKVRRVVQSDMINRVRFDAVIMVIRILMFCGY